MTVCTASLFFWNSSPVAGGSDWGPAFIAASDRMMTELSLGIEYETSRWKGAIIETTHMVLFSGDLTFSSEILADLNATLASDGKTHNTLEIALVTGELYARTRRQRLAKLYLAPLGIEGSSFVGAHAELRPELVLDLAAKLQKPHFDVEAIVVGVDGPSGGLFRVDEYGAVTNHNDTGFLSIGIGGIHASAQFMNEPYAHNRAYYDALYSTFVAKKRAEVTAGVGPLTDIFRITRDMVARVPDELVAVLEKRYAAQKRAAAKSNTQAAKRIFAEEQKYFAAQLGTPPEAGGST